MLNFGRKKNSYADRLRGTSVAPGMVAPTQTPYGARLNDLSEMLNTNNGKTMRTSVAPDMSSMRVLGDPVDPVQGPGRLLPDPKRAPRTAGRVGSSSGVSGIRQTASGQGIIPGISASKRAQPVHIGLDTRGVRPGPGQRLRPIAPAHGSPGMSGRVNRGSGNIPMLERGPAGGFPRYGDMGMGVPSNAARGGGNIPMLERGPAGGFSQPPRPGPVTSGPTPPTGGTGGARETIKSGGKQSGLRDAMKGKNFKRGALIAAGVLAAGSVVQSRRREGTSSGRQSMYRY
jgi:hypothetical protein